MSAESGKTGEVPAGNTSTTDEALGKHGDGKSELKVRMIFGPSMLLLIAGIYLLDSEVLEEMELGGRNLGGWATAAVLALLGFAGVHEYLTMLRNAGFAVASRLLPITSGLLLTLPFWFGWDELDRELYPMVAAAFVLLFPIALDSLTRRGMTQGLEMMGASMLGLIWVAWPMYIAQGIAIRHLPSVLFVVLVCKSGDIGAYFVGSFFGRRKLIPHISSGKTLEGAFGSVGASVLVGVLLIGLLPVPDADLREAWYVSLDGEVARVSIAGAALMSILLNLTTQTGDLIESLLKRRCGVKNSSNLLPAHGGVLDLIDSLLFSFPAFFWFLIVLT
ncbi:MAG: phosphatidate cytidylyltransferase [Planctomycetota bacterium]